MRCFLNVYCFHPCSLFCEESNFTCVNLAQVSCTLKMFDWWCLTYWTMFRRKLALSLNQDSCYDGFDRASLSRMPVNDKSIHITSWHRISFQCAPQTHITHPRYLHDTALDNYFYIPSYVVENRAKVLSLFTSIRRSVLCTFFFYLAFLVYGDPPPLCICSGAEGNVCLTILEKETHSTAELGWASKAEQLFGGSGGWFRSCHHPFFLRVFACIHAIRRVTW